MFSSLVTHFGWCSGSPLRYVIFSQPASQNAEKLGFVSSSFVSGYRFSDTASLSKSDAPLGAERAKKTFSANCSAAEVRYLRREC